MPDFLDELRQAAADEQTTAAFTALATIARTLGVYGETLQCESVEDVGVVLANTISHRWQRKPWPSQTMTVRLRPDDPNLRAALGQPVVITSKGCARCISGCWCASTMSDITGGGGGSCRG